MSSLYRQQLLNCTTDIYKFWTCMTLHHSPPVWEAQRSVDCSARWGWGRVAMALRHRLGRWETGTTDAHSERMGGATCTTTTTTTHSHLASASRCLVGGATSMGTRMRGDGGGLGGRIDVEDKSCVGICLFWPSIIINAAYTHIGIVLIC